jgi:hypothetical protein
MDADRWRVIARNQVKHPVEAVEAELHSIRHRLAEIALRRRRPNAADRILAQQLSERGQFLVRNLADLRARQLTYGAKP